MEAVAGVDEVDSCLLEQAAMNGRAVASTRSIVACLRLNLAEVTTRVDSVAIRIQYSDPGKDAHLDGAMAGEAPVFAVFCGKPASPRRRGESCSLLEFQRNSQGIFRRRAARVKIAG